MAFVYVSQLQPRLVALLGPSAPSAVRLRRDLEQSGAWRVWRYPAPMFPSATEAQQRSGTAPSYQSDECGLSADNPTRWWNVDAMRSKATEREPLQWEVIDTLAVVGGLYGGMHTRLVFRAIEEELGWYRPDGKELQLMCASASRFTRIAALGYAALTNNLLDESGRCRRRTEAGDGRMPLWIWEWCLETGHCLSPVMRFTDALPSALPPGRRTGHATGRPGTAAHSCADMTETVRTADCIVKPVWRR